MYYGSWKIDDVFTFYANTTRFDTGAATDADSVPSYRIYEDETGTAILSGTMALLDSSNTTGFYSEQITLSAANGFEKGKSYAIYIQATVNSVVGAAHHTLQIEAEVDANRVNWANVDNPTTTVGLSGTTIKAVTDRVTANVDQLGGVAQSLTDLKDFADDGYDPSTNKVQGVVLTDTATTVTNGVTVTTNNDKTGYSLSTAGVQAIWDALTSALTTAGSIGKLLVDNINATISSRSSHTAADVWAVATRLLTAGTNIVLAKGVGVTGFNDISTAQVNAEMVDVLQVDLIPDSYSALGAQPTITQSLMEIRQFLFEKNVTGVTVTIYKPDGTTTAFTLTLNDATTPSAITRAT